jgi:Family of unknown function (DUF6132)
MLCDSGHTAGFIYCRTCERLKLMKNWMIWGIGIVIGAAGGYLYWYFVGCVSGSCAITSSPVNSTLYGGLMGGLLGNVFSTPKKDNTIKKNETN